MIEKMSSLTMITPIESAEKLIDFAWSLGNLHLVRYDDVNLGDLDIDELLEEQLQQGTARYEELERFFAAYASDFVDTDTGSIETATLADADTRLDQLESLVNKWKHERASLDEQQTVFQKFETLLGKLAGIIPDVPAEGQLQVRAILLPGSSGLRLNEKIRDEITEVTDEAFDFTIHDIQPDLDVATLTYMKENDTAVLNILSKLQVSEVELPHDAEGETLKEKIDNLLESTKRTEERLAELSKDLIPLHADFQGLNEHRKSLVHSLSKFQGGKFIRVTEHFAILSAFVPGNATEEIENQAYKLFEKDEIALDFAKAGHDAPVNVVNRHGIKEFEVFTNMLPPLAYGSLDPAPWMALFFPLFFGFIVGDVGYGLIIGYIGWKLYRGEKNEKGESTAMNDLGWVLFVSALSSIVFGALFGEFMGDLGMRLYHHFTGHEYHWYILHRSHDLMTLLGIAVGLGVLHVMLGFVLGAINGLKTGHTSHFYFSVGLFFTDLGVFILAFSLLVPDLLTDTFSAIGTDGTTAGIILMAVGVVSIVKGEGVLGIIEIVGTFGNILSYARLMALGVASVVLADLANELYGTSGGGLLGLLVAVLLHGINIALAMFSPTIHSMRLHLVEFFSKFVEYGKEAFRPFGSEQTTQIGAA